MQPFDTVFGDQGGQTFEWGRGPMAPFRTVLV